MGGGNRAAWRRGARRERGGRGPSGAREGPEVRGGSPLRTRECSMFLPRC